MPEAPVILTINVTGISEDILERLGVAIATANLRAGGLLPGSPGTPDAPEASQPLQGAPEAVFQAPGTTPQSGANDPWKAPAEDPFSTTKTPPVDPWAADPLEDAIRRAPDEATLVALYKANKSAWNENYTDLATDRKGELSK